MLLIKNIGIVTQNKNREIIKNGAIVIDKDIIKAIGENRILEKQYSTKAKKIINGENKVALPGLINLHGHLAMTFLRGYADDLPLEKWWPEHIYPIESKFSRREVYWGSFLAIIEMIKSGTTFFADFYYFQEETAKAARQIGIRGLLGAGLLDVPTLEYKNIEAAFEISDSLLKKFKEDSLLKVSLCPHMLQTTSLETYRRAKQLARNHHLILQTHLNETKQEVDFSLKKYQKRPAETLKKENILDDKTILAHCCWLNKKEIAILAESGASAVHCPISNMKLASGLMPLPAMLKAGINIALGTDSACSNNNLDMFEEMKAAALIHKGHHLDAAAVRTQTALDMATVNGAKALGMEQEIGSLESGKKADLIILNFKQAHLTPIHNIVSHLVYAANGQDVETTVINGKIIMENKKIKKINEQKIFNKVQTIARELFAK